MEQGDKILSTIFDYMSGTVFMSLHNPHKILSRAIEQMRKMNSESLNNLPEVIHTYN